MVELMLDLSDKIKIIKSSKLVQSDVDGAYTERDIERTAVLLDIRLESVYTIVDEYANEQNWSEMNEYINYKMDVYDIEATELLITLLSVTLPYKELLPSREEAYNKIEDEIIRRYGNVPAGLLTGLE